VVLNVDKQHNGTVLKNDFRNIVCPDFCLSTIQIFDWFKQVVNNCTSIFGLHWWSSREQF
jgi:hypothetical protein